jgi:hypothetical protein
MKNSANLSLISKPLSTLLHKYHLTLFILCIVGCLVGAVLLLTNMLDEASNPTDYTSPISAGSIDQATLDRIDALHTSSGQLPQPLPATTRTSPFSE